MIDWTPWTTGPDADHWVALYDRAVAEGAHVRMTTEEERLLRPLALLVHAVERVRAAAFLMPALMLCGADCAPALRDDARRLAAGVVRFTACALEVHARDAGYRPGEWVAKGVLQAEFAVETADRFACVAHLEDAGRAIGSAIVASECDLMAVPDHLSSALGGGLALYATLAGGSGI